MTDIVTILEDNFLVSFIIAVIFGIPFLILYILEVFVILKNFKQFNSPFFVLFLIRFFGVRK